MTRRSHSGIMAVATLFTLSLLGASLGKAQSLASDFSLSPFPPASVVVDLNSDGKPDLIANDGSVYLGNGDGTFTKKAPLTLTGPMAVGDFNGDGKPDVAVAADLSVYVFLGNGDGTFQASIRTITGMTVYAFAAGDFNGDGKADLVGLSNSTPLFTLISKGDGTFASPVAVTGTTGTLNIVATGDFNHDGKLDFAAASTGQNVPGTIQAFLGNGDGTFQAVKTSTGVVAPYGFAVADFNGDGNADLVIGDGSQINVSVFLSNGDGTFHSTATFTPFGFPAVGDFNQDGKPDLVINNNANPFAAVYLGKGDGTFEAGVNYFVGVGSSAQPIGVPLVADFNGDGKVDLGSNNVLLLGKGDGTLQGNLLASGSFLQSGAPNESWVTGDFNGDGNPDVGLILNTGANSFVLEVYLGDGTGRLTSQGFTDMWNPGSPATLAMGDFNGDGKLDLLVVGELSGQSGWQYRLYLGKGDGTFDSPIISTPQEAVSGTVPILVADFNGDHISDFAAISSVGIRIYLGQTNGTFAGPTFVTMADGSMPNSFVAGDFNGDGKVDLAATTQGALNILLGKGDGTFQPAVARAISFPQSNLAYLTGAADLNGDGNIDLLIGGTSQAEGPGVADANADVLPGNGDGTFGALITNSFAVSQNSNGTGIGDINGDGIPDLVTSSTSGLQIALGNGDGTFGTADTLLPPVVQNFGGLAPNILLEDFNRDKKLDIAVFDAAGESGISILLNHVPAPGPSFLLAAKVLQPVAIAPGASGVSTVTVSAVGGFTGTVTLSCTGLPTGATCRFAPASIANGAGTSALTIAVSSTTAVGTYPIEISGTSSSIVRTQTLSLTIGTGTGATTVTVTPSTLAFAASPTGTASSPQSVTLANTGTAGLTISGISVSGTNGADFAQSNNCGTSLSVGASCQISVTFTPGGVGGRSATLSIADNATGSPQTASLTGNGPDFTVSASTSTATVAAGQSAMYTISLGSAAGFAQTVTLMCSGAPAGATCSVSPSMVAVSGGSAATATVTVTTTARSFEWPLFEGSRRIPLMLMLASGAAIVFLVFVGLTPRLAGIRWAPAVALGLLIIAVMTVTACGGGSSGGGGGSGTQPGNYTITVTGNFSTGSTNLSHATTLTLVVQ